MHSRRGFFAAAAGLAAGLFCLPGQAVAGLFRRRRCVPCCPPCPPCPSPIPPPRSDTIEITSPAAHNPLNRPCYIRGYFSIGGYGNAGIKCWIRYKDGSTHPMPVPCPTYSGNSWSVLFDSSTPPTNDPVDVFVQLYHPGCMGSYLDDDSRSFTKIT